jgi:hypothetical protein
MANMHFANLLSIRIFPFNKFAGNLFLPGRAATIWRGQERAGKDSRMELSARQFERINDVTRRVFGRAVSPRPPRSSPVALGSLGETALPKSAGCVTSAISDVAKYAKASREPAWSNPGRSKRAGATRETKPGCKVKARQSVE